MNYKFEFDINQINLIMAGLSELPYKQVHLFLNYIQSEISKQKSNKEPQDKEGKSK